MESRRDATEGVPAGQQTFGPWTHRGRIGEWGSKTRLVHLTEDEAERLARDAEVVG